MRAKSRVTMAAVAAVACVAVAVVSAPAASAGTDPQQELHDRHSSVAGSLIAAYAKNSGTTIKNFVETKRDILDDIMPKFGALSEPLAAPELPAPPTLPDQGNPVGTAAPTPTLPSRSGPLLTESPTLPSPSPLPSHTTPPELPNAATTTPAGEPVNTWDMGTVLDRLNTALAGADLTMDTSGYESFRDLAGDVAAKSQTIDGAVTLAAANWANDLANIHMPDLNMPHVDSPSSPGIPGEALLFGLLGSNAIGNLIADQPDIFAQVDSSGLGTPEVAQAWQNALMDGYKQTLGSLGGSLLNPCVGAMLEVAASGEASSAGEYGRCAPACITSGVYLNEQLMSAIDPGFDPTVKDPFSDVWGWRTLSGLQRWQLRALDEQNPDITQRGTIPLLSDSPGDCKKAETATQNALSGILPGVFDDLSTGGSVQTDPGMPGLFGNLEDDTSGQTDGTGLPDALTENPSGVDTDPALPGVFDDLETKGGGQSGGQSGAETGSGLPGIFGDLGTN